ncbi:roadblock/LC7 domain-containing protein [Amycolatopsis viridis]|uniref:Regulator of Ras-like GTPase activity (Roadblock/LC7/MglB family) n=1 Tax=Amycolatopsis viridis TaxID=185678 RepID=A0ABX0SLX7_9PSEU|nr:roadblock/LC7 domain-containing protein [Amycolatopsis viridis]NIH77981.1 putative regulator of Ras-like GTPase activity (Roadblock/LC7/MglB family) [Amycolatopsis viridis]
MTDDLTWLLHRLVDRVPGSRSAVLLSADGIAKNWYGLADDEAETLAAMAGSICSLAKAVGTRFGGTPEGNVRQVLVETDGSILFVTAPSIGTVLAVLAGPGVDAATLSYEMGRLGDQLPQQLATPARQDIAAAQLGNR